MNGVEFRSSATAADAFRVFALEGEERIGRPYRFALELDSREPALALEAIVGAPATLSLAVGDARRRGGSSAGRVLEGVVLELDELGPSGAGYYRYRALFGPRLALLAHVRQTRIYQDLTVPELVEAVLATSGLSLALELRLAAHYPKRKHVVQYQESALDFVSRLLEHAGVGYFFEYGSGGERLVLCDHPGGYGASVRASMQAESDAAHVSALRCRRRIVPQSLLMLDCSPSESDAPLQGEAAVDARGFGVSVEIAEPFASPEEGARLAALRAEELCARATMYAGTVSAPLAAGGQLELTGAYRADFDRRYLVTVARHVAWRDAGSASTDSELLYRCEFEACDAARAWRPERTTPKPKMHGSMVARVDAAGPEGTVATDGDGNYRVALPFDLRGAPEGEASMPMRHATPYAGPGEGMEFTLRKGAEIVWTCIDGDPDRPLIAAALPERARRSATAHPGETRSAIHMANGALFEMGSTQIDQLGPVFAAESNELPLEQQESETGVTFTDPNVSATTHDYVRIAVPHGDGNWSYVRYGDTAGTYTATQTGVGTFNESTNMAGPFTPKYRDTDNKRTPWEWEELDAVTMEDSTGNKGTDAYFGNAAGIYDYTDVNRTVITKGDYQSVTQGNRTDVVLGNYRLVIPRRTLGVYDTDFYSMTFHKGWQGWHKEEKSHVSSLKLSYGDNSSFFAGINFAASLAGNYNLAGGINGNVFLGLDAGLKVGMACNIMLGPTLDFSAGKKLSTAGDQDIKAREKIVLRVHTQQPGAASAWKVVVPGLVAGAAGAIVGPASVATGQMASDGGFAVSGVLWGATMLGALAGAYASHKIAHSHGFANAEIKIRDEVIRLQCNQPPPGVAGTGPQIIIQRNPDLICIRTSNNGPYIEVRPDGIELSMGNPQNDPSVVVNAQGVRMSFDMQHRFDAMNDSVGMESTAHFAYASDANGFQMGEP